MGLRNLDKVNQLAAETRRKSFSDLSQSIPKTVNLTAELLEGTPLQDFDCEVTVSTNVLSNLQGNAAEVRTNIETALVQGSSIIGDGTDGETFGGFVKSIGNEASRYDVGVCKLEGDFGLEGNGSGQNVVAYCSGAPQAIELTRLKVIKDVNERNESWKTFLDNLPDVLGAPSGGFLGTLLKVVGVIGAAGVLLPQISPLQGLTDKLTTLKDNILRETGIQGVIDDIKGAYNNAMEHINGAIEGVTTSFNEVVKDTLGEVDTGINGLSQSLTNEAGNAANSISSATANGISVNLNTNIAGRAVDVNQFSLGGIISDLAEAATGVLTAEVKRLTSFNIPDIQTANIVNRLVQGGTKRVNAVANMTILDGNVTTLLNKFEPLTGAGSFTEDGIDAEEVLRRIEEAGKKSGANAAQIKEVQDAFRNKLKEVSENDFFTNQLESIISEVAVQPPVAEFKQIDKYSYIGSVEELEKEFFQRVMRSGRNVDSTIIHATETFTNKNIGAEEIDDFAVQLGQEEIGYHYVIRRDGRLQRGRSVEQEGDHAPYNFNKTSIGLVMVGGINRASTESLSFTNSSASFTRAQYDTLELFLKTFYNHLPGGEVYGHNELKSLFSTDTDGEEEPLDEQEFLDPFFDVSEYIYSLFGKINRKQVEDQKLDDWEEGVIEGLLISQTATLEDGTDIIAEFPDDSQNELDFASRQTPSGRFAARQRSLSRIAQGLPVPLPTIQRPSNGEFVVEYAYQSSNGKNVDPSEFRGLGKNIPSKLLQIANTIGSDLRVTSGFRTEAQNASIGGAVNSNHLDGVAVDFQIMAFEKIDPLAHATQNKKSITKFYHNEKAHEKLYTLVQKARELKFQGIHLYTNFVHLDMATFQCGNSGVSAHSNRPLGDFLRSEGYVSWRLGNDK
jgi:N-acetylmuramoyl-L-alanine amidase